MLKQAIPASLGYLGRHAFARYIAMAFCLIATSLWVVMAASIQHSRAQRLFDHLSSNGLRSLDDRLQQIELAMNGAAGLLHASENVTPEDWGNYFQAINLPTTIPGLEGIGLTVPLMGETDPNFAALTAELAQQGAEIHPRTDQPEKMIVRFMAPAMTNKPALGLDFAFDEKRQAAAIFARDSGQMTVSGPVELVQQVGSGPGFILLRPVYAPDGPPVDTPEARRAAFRGWIAAPFTASGLLGDLTVAQGRYFTLDVFDRKTGDIVYAAPTPATTSHHSGTDGFSVYGQDWQMVWSSTPAFDYETRSWFPVYIGLTGLAVTFLIALQSFILNRRNEEIQKQVDLQTRALQETAEQNGSIIRNAFLAIAVLSEDCRILSVNPAFERLFGYDRSELDSRLLSDVIPEIAGKNPTKEALFLQGFTKTGTRLFLKLQCNNWVDASGQRLNVILIDDTTSEQLATDNLREKEHRWNLALSAAEIGVFDLDLETGVMAVSPSWLKLMNLPHHDKVVNPKTALYDRIHPDDLPQFLAKQNDCIAGTIIRALTSFRVQTSPGEWRWIHSNANVAEWDAFGRARRFIGAQTDVTRLRQMQDSLRESRKQFRNIIEVAPVPMALVDMNGCFTRVNDALLALTGYTHGDLIGTDFKTLVHDNDRTGILKAVQEQIEGVSNVYHKETRFLHKEGHMSWMMLSVSLARDGVQNDSFFIAQFVDISQRKEIEKSNREFFANMSHELRTPLTSVKGSIDLVLGTMGKNLPDAASRLLQIAQGNTGRLVALINDLLDLEKISTSEMNFDFAVHDIGEVVRGAVTAIGPMATNHGVAFRTHTPDSPINLWLDGGRTEQILTNLLSNAVKFSDSGGTVTVRTQVRGDDLHILVQDTGRGIPESYRSRLFQPFSQANSSATRAKGGTGLGLSIAKNLTEQMGGKIGFESTVGQGTTFWLSFPLTCHRPGQTAKTTEPRHHILYLYQDRSFCTVLSRSLGPAYRVAHTADPEMALAKLRETDFDLTIIEQDDFSVDGHDVMAQILDIRPDLPVLHLCDTNKDDDAPVTGNRLIHKRLPVATMVARCAQFVRKKELQQS